MNDRRKMQEGKTAKKMLDRLTKWLKVVPTATKGRDAWKVMIAYATKKGT